MKRFGHCKNRLARIIQLNSGMPKSTSQRRTACSKRNNKNSKVANITRMTVDTGLLLYGKLLLLRLYAFSSTSTRPQFLFKHAVGVDLLIRRSVLVSAKSLQTHQTHWMHTVKQLLLNSMHKTIDHCPLLLLSYLPPYCSCCFVSNVQKSLNNSFLAFQGSMIRTNTFVQCLHILSFEIFMGFSCV